MKGGKRPMDKRTNISRLIDQKGMVEKSITEFERGVVKVGYEEWSAESEDGQPIEAGTVVLVTAISGVTLTVKKEA
jgi:membrane protein implicated in regulation of membrane protease activity